MVKYAVKDSKAPDLEPSDEYVTFTAKAVNGQWEGQTTFIDSQVTEQARQSVWQWLINALIKLILIIFGVVKTA